MKIINKVVSIANNKTLRNGSLFTLFSFLNQGIGFFIMLIMGRYVLPDSYGKLSLFTTIIQLLSIFICLGTNGIIAVDFFKHKKEYIQRLVNVVMLSALGVYAVMLLLVLTLPTQLERIVGIDAQYQLYAISVCLFQIVSAVILDIWRLEEKVTTYGLYSCSSTVSNLVLTFVFVACLHWDWQGRVYANVLTCLVFFIIGLYFLIKKKYLVWVLPSKAQWKESLKFGVPLIPHSMSFWMRQGMDRYVINLFLNHAAVGLFSFASNLGNIVQIIGFSFNASNSVHIYQLLSTDAPDKVAKLNKECRYLVMLYTLIAFAIFAGGAILTPIIFPKYAGSVKYLLPLCIGGMLQCYYLVYVNILFFYKTTKLLMYITFSSSLIHVGLSFWLTRYGVMYTSCVMVISNLLIFIGVYIYSRQVLHKFNNNVSKIE